MQTGSCLCEQVAFTIEGPLRPVIACHCGQCRKTSGHYWAATSAPLSAIRFTGDASLTWFRASDTAERGFCSNCGSSLFWRPDGQDRMAIAAGALDGPTGLSCTSHVFVADKGSYYEIADDLPQHSGFSGGENV